MRKIILLIALVAFAWQAFITQSHRHADLDVHTTTVAASVGVPTALAAGSPASDQPANCPICQEIAHSGLYYVPGIAVFHAPDAVAPWVNVSTSVALALTIWSHAWRSRAPPYRSKS